MGQGVGQGEGQGEFLISSFTCHASALLQDGLPTHLLKLLPLLKAFSQSPSWSSVWSAAPHGAGRGKVAWHV